MKSILASLALAAVGALGLASRAEAAPMSPVAPSVALHGRWGGGIGIGISTGGGYYAPTYAQPVYAQPVYSQPSGYYTTQYRWVPTTVFAGYDAYNRPVYNTQYVQQAYQVWVPTASYYTPNYAPAYSYGYSRPRVSIGFGLGYRWR